MTCIVGLATADGRAFIGGDSCASVDDNLFMIANGKVFQKGEFIFGCAGTRRASEIIRFSFEPPPLATAAGESAEAAYMASVFADALRKLFAERGAVLKDESNGDSFGGSGIIALRGRIYFLSGNFSVTPVADGIWATGCGRNVALGSLRSTAGKTPHERIKTALECAVYYSDGVRPPFNILPPEGR